MSVIADGNSERVFEGAYDIRKINAVFLKV